MLHVFDPLFYAPRECHLCGEPRGHGSHRVPTFAEQAAAQRHYGVRFEELTPDQQATCTKEAASVR